MRVMNRIHKWTAISVSVFLLMWLVSGMVMTIPTKWLQVTRNQESKRTLDPADRFDEVTVSIRSALETVEESGQSPAIREIKLIPMADTIAYIISTQNNKIHIVDAFTGEPVTIDAEHAAGLLYEHLGTNVEIETRSLQEDRDFYYWGPTPVYRFDLAQPKGTTVYVSAVDGRIQTWSRLARLRRMVTSLHGFEPVRLVARRDFIRVGLLLVASIAGLATIATGLYLALPVRFRYGLRSSN